MKKNFMLLLLLLSGFIVRAQSVSFTLNQQPCNANGVITANFTSLTPPLTVTWHLGANTVVHSNVNTLSDVLTGYTGIPFYIVVQDANSNATDAFYQGAAPFSYQVGVTNAVCPASGSASVSVTGGTAPYTYQWIDMVNNNVVSTANPATLPNGQYGVMITDASGCVYGSLYHPDSIYVHAEAPFNYTVSTTQANCTNGSATVAGITGSGVPPYTYQWSNGASTSSITNLTAGYYQVTVTDAQGCQRTRGEQVHQSITINANATVTPATCTQNNGAIISFGSGGSAPYTYLYSNGGTAQNQTNLAPGSYTVHVTDANGCTGASTVYVGASSPVTATYTAVPSSCTTPNGSATLTVSGGQAPYSVSWNTFPAQTGMTASGLAPGNYSFHITDANGCVREGVANIPPVNVITATLTSTNAVCIAANGAINVIPSGGATPYTYLWNNGATTQNISGLAAGNYSVIITDAAGCSVTKHKNVEASSPVNTGLTATPASCVYSADGSIAATVWGGTAPYTYQWSNGQTTPSATGLAAGSYWLQVTDANGCTRHSYTGLGYGNGNACYCTITGTVYHDLNGNCVKDAGEPGIPNIQMHLSGFGYAYTNASGVYSFQVPSGSYTLSETVQSIYPLSSCQNNMIAVTAAAASGCTQTYDFGNTVNPIHDMHISTWNNGAAVPGNTYSQTCVISNQGTVTESNILAGYSNDGQLGAPSFAPGGLFAAGGTNWYTTSGNLFPTLIPAASQAFNVSYNVPSNIPMGTNLAFRDSVVYAAPMSGWVSDYSPWDNVDQHDAVIVSSYDPNFKEVSPKGEGPTGQIGYADSVLEYMVHFQNLGTYFAQNVVVIDTLDAHLDWKSLRPIYSSHNAKISIDENGVMRYTFKNINLPAKMTDEAGSNGMFVYSIKTKRNLPLGTQFFNTAAIYFDYNEPVITNRTVNTLSNITSVEDPGKTRQFSFVLYPNPAQDGFTVIAENKIADAPATLTVSDISGRVLLSREMRLAAGKQLIGMGTGALGSGIYFVNLHVGDRKSTQKLVIVK